MIGDAGRPGGAGGSAGAGSGRPPNPDDVEPGRPAAGAGPGGTVSPDDLGPGAATLVIGYGNALRSDDAVGLHAAGMLARDPRLARASVLARHQLTPDLALDMSRASLVVLIDASVDAAPGEIVVRSVERDARLDSQATGRPGGTTHHVGVEELVALAAGLYGAAPEVTVVGIGVATVETGDALSPDVAAALPAVAEIVADIVARHEQRPG